MIDHPEEASFAGQGGAEALIPEQEEQNETIDERRGNMSVAAYTQKYTYLMSFIGAFSVILGMAVGFQPAGEGWRLFSWHPLLMTIGYIGLLGGATLTKKLGGYTNTKIHSFLASLGLALAVGGFYAIYRNKAIHNKDHFTSWHSWLGVVILLGSLIPMLVGIIFLHPDFGVDNTNQLKRTFHKWLGRLIISLSWANCILGLMNLTDDRFIQIMYLAPLLCLIPFVLG